MISRRSVLRGMGQASAIATLPSFSLTALAQAPKAVPLTIGIGGYTFAYLPLLAAKATNILLEEGLDVSLVNTGSGTNTLAAMLGGSIEVSGLVMSDVILAAAKGQKIQAFAPLMSQYASDAIISVSAAKKVGIEPGMPLKERMARMKGLVLAVSGRGSGIDKLWRYMLALGGLDPDRDVTLTVVKLDQMYSALKSGQIDGFNTTAPANNRAVDEGLAVWVARPSQGEVPGLENFLYTALCARPGYTADKADVAGKLTRGLARASQMLQDNPKEVGRLMQKEFFGQTDLQLIESAVVDQRKTAAVPPTLSQQQFDQNLEFMVRFGHDVKGVTYRDVIDPRLLSA
ncbi:hypothetical protein GCM10007301_08510 [Azorhizobium oxalatiphilum]|uniref:ABC transporter substrate-binding protein n=1 Tax=Azorhizobium oxalatiphilum TaxID=980631 RepID=A0A917BR40_9HYPH|nr:ABC transporter substrate-binding protein [Azorhizobium oxalatiphilum]GGF51378.1 hypothetical protein GCM10007301_08510 [Azorhizobium oxalatiphilum]